MLDNPAIFHLLILEVIGRCFIWDPTGYILRCLMMLFSVNLAWDKFPMVSQKSGKLKGFWDFDSMPSMNNRMIRKSYFFGQNVRELDGYFGSNLMKTWKENGVVTNCNKGKCDSDKKINLAAVKLSCYKFGNCGSIRIAENKCTIMFFFNFF